VSDHKIISSLMRPFFRKGQESSFSVPDALTENSRILCIDAGDLSDVLFHMPLLTAIKRRFPKVAMDFLLPEKHASLVVPTGLAKQCIIYQDGQLNPWRPAFGSLLRKLGGGGGYDIALVMSYEARPRLELAALASGAGLRYGPSHPDSWPAINFEMRASGIAGGYRAERLLRTAPFLGFRADELAPRWPLPMDKVRQMAQQIHFHKPNPDQMLIGVDPGLSKTGHSFGLENLQFLVRQISGELACKILPLSRLEEKDRLEKFEMRLSDVPVGLKRESLLEMILLLSQCDLFIGTNTDFFHFAVALGVPAIGLFSKFDGPEWEPIGRPKAKVIRLTKAEKVDIETLTAAVNAVTDGRTSTASTVISVAEDFTADAASGAPSNG
jgi:ADP-heptose:LPS heptosyltransferase